ncbi:Pancreatic lipase-related protein 2 [Halotydeus destructor]|nr:Pancreatic lipase-related protein 2 [Halotydeus destructor]
MFVYRLRICEVILLCVSVLVITTRCDESDDYCVEYVQDRGNGQCVCATDVSCLCTFEEEHVKMEPCYAAAALEDMQIPAIETSRQALDADNVTELNLGTYHPLLGVIRSDMEPISHIGRLPSTPAEIQTTFTAHRTSGRAAAYNLTYKDRNEMVKLKESLSKRPEHRKLETVYVVVHGFHEKMDDNHHYDTLRSRLAYANLAIAEKPKSLIIMVDWSKGAKPKKTKGIIYTQAAINTVVVGRELAVLLNQLVTEGMLNPLDVHCIGFGLGAQIIHFAARWFSYLSSKEVEVNFDDVDYANSYDGYPPNVKLLQPLSQKLGRLTGLDPTARHFQGYVNKHGVIPYINRYDAHFVDVIHTSAVKRNGNYRDMLKKRFGMSTPVGHIDFYVNGGQVQPGCRTFEHTCSHKKAVDYFIASLTKDVAEKLKLRAVWMPSYSAYLREKYVLDSLSEHVPEAVVPLGLEAQSSDGRGIFYLLILTNDVFELLEPFALPEKYDGLRFEVNELEDASIPEPGYQFSDFPIHDLNEIETRPMNFALDEPACGKFRQPANQTGRIQNGHQSYNGQFPWVVCIVAWESVFLGYGTHCTGTILSDEFIVTAAHCFWEQDENGVKVPTPQGTVFYMVYGTTDCEHPLHWRLVIFDKDVTVIQHPNYNPHVNKDDIALIKLIDPITGLPDKVYNGELINTVCYDTEAAFGYSCDDKVYFAGVGSKFGDVPTPELTWTQMNPFNLLLSQQLMHDYTPQEIGHSASMRYRSNEHGIIRQPCGGDSGGPYVWYVRDSNANQASDAVSPYRAVLIGTEIGGYPCKGAQPHPTGESDSAPECLQYVRSNGGSCECVSSSESCSCKIDGRSYLLDPCSAAIALEESNTPEAEEILASRQVLLNNSTILDLRSVHLLLGIVYGDIEPVSHIGKLPWSPLQIKTKFTAYSRRQKKTFALTYNETTSELGKYKNTWDGQKLFMVHFVIHDFDDKLSGNRDYETLRHKLEGYAGGLADKEGPDSLVIEVDWLLGAKPQLFKRGIRKQAVVNTVVVGREVALICRELVNAGLVDSEDLHLIGFGLGAQVSHFAARWFSTLFAATQSGRVDPNFLLDPITRQRFPAPPRLENSLVKLGRLTGLDPTARHFQGYVNKEGVIPYINRFDAQFVDIIHTSAVKNNGKDGELGKGRVGMSTPVGHIDFYPNGGRKQPDCGRFAKSCHHRKALHYFISSITSDSQALIRLRARKAASYKEFTEIPWKYEEMKTRAPSIVSVLGMEAQNADGIGIFYLTLSTDQNFQTKSVDGIVINVRADGMKYREKSELESQYLPDPGSVFTKFPIHDTSSMPEVVMESDVDTPACGQFREPPSQIGRVANGHQAYLGQFPWLACILKYEDETDGYTTMCTGTILTDEFIVTAAHCFMDEGEDGRGVDMPQGTVLYITYGSTDCNNPLDWRRMVYQKGVTAMRHSRYRYASRNHDISLIKLLKPITGLPNATYNGETLNTVCYDNFYEFSYSCSENLYFAGAGMKVTDVSSPYITWTQMSTFDKDLALAVVYHSRNQEPEMVEFEAAAVYRNNELNVVRQPCGGDSGGPYVWYVRPQNGGPTGAGISPFRAILVGTEIGGESCFPPEVHPKFHNVHGFEIGTRFQHPMIHKWLLYTMKRHSRSNRDDVEPDPLPEYLKYPLPYFADI